MGASASKARATSMDFQVWEALLHTAQTQKPRPVSTDLTFDTISYTIWSQKHWRLTSENAPPPKDAQLQPCFLLKIPASQPLDYAQIIQQLEEVQVKDDVTSSSFLQNVVVASHGRSSLELEVEVAAALNARGLQTLTFATLQRGCDIETGPHLLHGNDLWKVAKLYDDTNGAFVAAIRPGEEENKYENLRLCSDRYQTLSVAIPSRASALSLTEQGSDLRLSGMRFAVKDMYSVAGLKTSLCSRPYYAVSKRAEVTAPCITRLLSEGCTLVGMLKLSSFIGREEPTEAIDYPAPFNPRGDGYQSPAGSSSGSAAGLASYAWLDFTLGSDTTGSGRRPAFVNGVFALRLSKERLPLEGMVPTFDRFDTQCIFTRDINKLDTILQVWLDNCDIAKVKADLPKRLLYPVDFFPVDNEVQMQHVKSFVQDFSDYLQAPVTELDLSLAWERSHPNTVYEESLDGYLSEVSTKTFLYDFYQSFDNFRETYKREFQKEPYANEYTQWRWDVAKLVTKEEHEDAVARLDTYRDWLLSEVFQADRYETLMILPVSEVAPNYRDRKTEPPSKQNAFDALYISPTMEAPEIVVPIAEFPYASRVSGREEKLPIAISVVGNPGTDLALVGLVRDFLKASNRPMRVSIGSSMFDSSSPQKPARLEC